MDTTELFTPSFHAYAVYSIEFCIRYFAIAGGFYWLFHVVFKQQWLAYRIQQTFPERGAIRHEIRWSLVNAACSGVSTLLIYHLVHSGRTSMYFGIADHGWMYFGLSIVLCLAGYDAWIYWQHRWMHTPFMFRHVHWIHHRVGNPTALATFAQHPLETFMGNAFFILFVVYVPMHPMAIAAAGLYMFLYGIIGHLGYEFYPAGFTRHRVLGFFNTATYHNMHHSLVGCNYGAWFTWWDRLMGTNHPAYHDIFDAVKARVAAASGAEDLPVSTRRAA